MKRVGGGRYSACRRKKGGALPLASNKAIFEADDYGDSSLTSFASLDVNMAKQVYTSLKRKAIEVCNPGADGLPALVNNGAYDGAAITKLQELWKEQVDTFTKAFITATDAPADFANYLPWFVAYDMLQIKATKPLLDERVKIAYIKLSELMRSLPPRQEPNLFSRWEEYYRDFKEGVFGGGKDAWLYNQRVTTPYDPANPLFHFTPERSRIEVKGASPSLYGDYDVMRILDIKPQGTKADQFTQGPFVGTGWQHAPEALSVSGGRMRRRAYPSRRRF